MRGHAPPGPPRALPYQPDLVVVGPMARSAIDLELALDVIAGPDEAREGIAYRLALPSPRHEDLKSFRVLVIDRHPLCPTAASITGALNGLAERLGKAGCKIVRETPKLPDLALTGRVYRELLNGKTDPKVGHILSPA